MRESEGRLKGGVEVERKRLRLDVVGSCIRLIWIVVGAVLVELLEVFERLFLVGAMATTSMLKRRGGSLRGGRRTELRRRSWLFQSNLFERVLLRLNEMTKEVLGSRLETLQSLIDL